MEGEAPYLKSGSFGPLALLFVCGVGVRYLLWERRVRRLESAFDR